MLVDITPSNHSTLNTSLPTLPCITLRWSLSGSEVLYNLLRFYSQGHSTQIISSTFIFFTAIQIPLWPLFPLLTFCPLYLPASLPSPTKPSSSLAWTQHWIEKWAWTTVKEHLKMGAKQNPSILIRQITDACNFAWRDQCHPSQVPTYTNMDVFTHTDTCTHISK